MAKVTQPVKEELEFRPRSSEPRAGVPASRRPPQWQGGYQEGGGLGGLTQMQVLLSAAHLSGCSALARRAEKGRWSLLVCNAPGLSA